MRYSSLKIFSLPAKKIDTYWAEFLSLLDNRVEQRQREAQFLIIVRLGAIPKLTVIKLIISVFQIRFYTSRGLDGHFHRILQRRYREDWRRHAREPQSEIFVGCVKVEFLTDRLQAFHPRGGQMAILQQNPAAVPRRPGSLLDHSFRALALAFTQRNRIDRLDTNLICERVEITLRIRTSGQHENLRRDAIGVFKNLVQLKHRYIHELLSQSSYNEILYSLFDLVLSDSINN